MKIEIQKLAVLAIVLAMALTVCACGAAPEIALPPIPTYSDESPLPSETVAPSPKATATAVPSPTTTAAPTVSSSPVPTATPSPLPTVETDVPSISISEATLPEDMVQFNVAMLRGIVTTDKGNIVKVSAALLDTSGNELQSCYFQPMLPSFSLGGTVNAQLQFAMLQPETYTYVLDAVAENKGISIERRLIEHQFTVYSSAAEMNRVESGEEGYTDRISIDSDNAAVIWNFLIVYLDNPYGAAGVLANIDVESGCDPRRVQGDFSEGFAYSVEYTQLVDEGNVNRDSFIWTLPGESYGSGYGLCQWTLDRKEGLYDLAKKDGTSIGDLNTQCTYLIMELELKYPELSKLLKTTGDAREAAREFFYVFEQGSEMGARPDIAEDYLEKFAK